MKALIVGGGIGGLAAAIALRRAGIEAVVFEQAPALREGADGIHSKVRELLLGDPQRYCGYLGWQGVAAVSHPDYPLGLSTWSYGRGAQFGLIPVGGGRVFWFGTTTVPEPRIPSLGPHRE